MTIPFPVTASGGTARASHSTEALAFSCPTGKRLPGGHPATIGNTGQVLDSRPSNTATTSKIPKNGHPVPL